MADKIVVHISQHAIRIVGAEHDMLQQVINILMSIAKLFHCEKQLVMVREEEGEHLMAPSQPHKMPKGILPKELDNDEARRVLDGLVDIQVLDENYQPLGLSWYQRGFLAKRISEKLGIRNVWKVMGELWGMTTKKSQEALRSSFNKAFESEDLPEFIDRIKPVV